MKKLTRTLCLALGIALLLSSAVFAAGENRDTLADWNIAVTVPEGRTAVLRGSSYYIYGRSAGTIPYVMLCVYRYDSEEAFIEDFTGYMKKQYADLTVTAPVRTLTLGGRACREIDYTYKVSGYDVLDRRVVLNVNGRTYMFASKEIVSRGDVLGGMLEEVIENCVFLDDEGEPLSPPAPAEPKTDAWVFRTPNGMVKYWLDYSGAMADTLVLHCHFRSGDPTFYETVYLLDLDSAEVMPELTRIRTVRDRDGNDLSSRFTRLEILTEGDGLTLLVERDPATLAGGADDNLLDGSYAMEPAGVGLGYECRGTDGRLRCRLTRSGGDWRLTAPTGESWTLRDPDADDGPVREIRTVLDGEGRDISDRFRTLTLTQARGRVRLNVRLRSGVTLEGLTDGVYTFEPRTFLRPAEAGPYTAAALAAWARDYALRTTGFYPPEAEARENADGTFTIHLYELVSDADGAERTAASARYTVDGYGLGTDDITGRPVDLFG